MTSTITFHPLSTLTTGPVADATRSTATRRRAMVWLAAAACGCTLIPALTRSPVPGPTVDARPMSSLEVLDAMHAEAIAAATP